MSHPPPPQYVDYSITQHIPVADHVYKYLIKRCGSDEIRANRNNVFGSLILSLLGKNPDVKSKKTTYTKIFKINIAEDGNQRLGMFISSENAQLFNDQVDKMFREELFFHVVINKGIDSRMYLDSIRCFLKVYDITEEDIKLDSLYKDFKRRKKKYDIQINLVPTSG